MTDTKHTPEPWTVFDMNAAADFVPIAHIGQTEDGKDLWVGQSHTQMPESDPESDARRIVACVIACTDIPTEGLDGVNLKKTFEKSAGILAERIEWMTAELAKVKAERDALVGAFEAYINLLHEECVELSQIMNHRYGGYTSKRFDEGCRLRGNIDRIKAGFHACDSCGEVAAEQDECVCPKCKAGKS